MRVPRVLRLQGPGGTGHPPPPTRLWLGPTLRPVTGWQLDATPGEERSWAQLFGDGTETLTLCSPGRSRSGAGGEVGTGPGCSPPVWEGGDGGGKGGEHLHVTSSQPGHNTPRPLAGRSHGKRPWLRAHIHPMQFYCCLSARVQPSLRSLPPVSAVVKHCPFTPVWDGKPQQHDPRDSMGGDEGFGAPTAPQKWAPTHTGSP